jgi:perosamine synthetase
VKFPVFEPDFGQAEIDAVTAAMHRGEISGLFGRAVSDFEEAFAAYCGVGHGVAVSNGTTALQLAARVAGVGPGDEVLVSASTNIASALAAYHNGAVTVPVDSEDRTWNLDLDLLEGLTTERTKAVIVVHLFGNPVDMPRLMAFARRRGLIVIEDCAEAHGAEWDGQKAGSFGDFSCFSFLSNKVITTGEGGMVLVNDDARAEELRSLRSLGFGKPRFLHPVAAYNFRLSAIQAAMGVVQTARMEEVAAAKLDLFARYQNRLANVEGIRFAELPKRGRHIQWMVAIRIGPSFGATRDQLAGHLRSCGIDTRTFFCPMNQQPFLVAQPGYRVVECPVADRMWEDGLYLPSTTKLTDADLDEICKSLIACPRDQ